MAYINGIVRFTRLDMEIIDEAIAYLNKTYPQFISAEQLSEEVNLHAKKLQAGFKKRTGYTVHNYQLKLHIDKVTVELKDPQLTLQIIFQKNGFRDKSQFGKIFKKFTGKTPTEYRHQFMEYE